MEVLMPSHSNCTVADAADSPSLPQRGDPDIYSTQGTGGRSAHAYHDGPRELTLSEPA
jgi:hypothetical protein